MEHLLKGWEKLGDENQRLFRKGVLAGLFLYIALLVVHDLLPYVLVMLGGLGAYKWITNRPN